MIRPDIDGFQPPPCAPDTLDCVAEPMIGAIIVDPQERNVVYGTAFGGVVRSTDGGFTWRYVAGLPEGAAVTALGLDGRTLLAGVDGKASGTTGVYEYTFAPPNARRRAVRP